MKKKRKATPVDVSEAGRRGGEARAQNLSPEQRKEIARMGALARLKKYYARDSSS